ncbi:hypothetical protein ACLBOM_00795 [Escherichia coli]
MYWHHWRTRAGSFLNVEQFSVVFADAMLAHISLGFCNSVSGFFRA